MLHVYPENQSSPMFFDTFEDITPPRQRRSVYSILECFTCTDVKSLPYLQQFPGTFQLYVNKMFMFCLTV